VTAGWPGLACTRNPLRDLSFLGNPLRDLPFLGNPLRGTSRYGPDLGTIDDAVTCYFVGDQVVTGIPVPRGGVADVTKVPPKHAVT
jgi:hypothetical protein